MRGAIFLLLACVSVPAEAGIRAVYDEAAAKRQIVFEIDEEGNFRAGDDRHYRLVRGDDAYQVAEVDGQVHVAHLTDLAAALKETASPLLRAAAKSFTFLGSREQEWIRLGRKRVNGWRGREYRLQDTFPEDPDDPLAHDDDTTVVISEDPALEPLGDAVLRYTAEELYLKRHFVSGAAYDEVLRDLDGLAELGTVIASSEGGIRLVSVGEADVAPERLELPAKPMTREEIVALMRAKRNPFKAALK